MVVAVLDDFFHPVHIVQASMTVKVAKVSRLTKTILVEVGRLWIVQVPDHGRVGFGTNFSDFSNIAKLSCIRVHNLAGMENVSLLYTGNIEFYVS